MHLRGTTGRHSTSASFTRVLCRLNTHYEYSDAALPSLSVDLYSTSVQTRAPRTTSRFVKHFPVTISCFYTLTKEALDSQDCGEKKLVIQIYRMGNEHPYYSVSMLVFKFKWRYSLFDSLF